MNKFFLFLALFTFSCTVFAQQIDRQSLRKNDRTLQRKVYYAKSNHTTVDISNRMKSTIKKISFLEKILKTIESKNKVHLLVNKTLNKTYSSSKYNVQSYGLESKSTGIVLPKLSVLLSQAESFSLYKDHIVIGGQKYLSPLYNPKYYHIEDSVASDTVFLNFEPIENKKYLLRGHLSYDTSSEQIIEFYAENQVKNNIEFHYQTIKVLGNYYPHRKHTKMVLGKKDNITINSYSTYFDYKPLSVKRPYSAIILDNDKYFRKSTQQIDSTKLDTIFGDEYERTKQFFNSVTKTENTTNLFRDLYQIADEAELPIKMINLRLNRLINFNNYEGFRFGLGAETNSQFNEFFSVGGYAGYGLRDREWKLGGDFEYHLDHLTKTDLNFRYENTITEPGSVNLPLSNKLFGNENYRRFGLENVQRERSVEFNASTHYFKWIALQSGFTNGNIRPYFYYIYEPLGLQSNFNYRKWATTVRITPFEKFIKSYNRLISIGSGYPTIWLNFETGRASGIGYNRWDFKLQKKFKFVTYGDFIVELLAGTINKDLPYPFLYNMRGSYNPFTPIINNSFMTMGYNEFFTNNYVALFANHNFGEIWSPNQWISPELVILHNMGMGRLKRPDNHVLISSGSMEKGYLESGFYFKNLLVIQNLIGKTGLGVGTLYRYGPYARNQFINNFVLKFAVDFQL